MSQKIEKTNLRVSVIIPTYNGARYLAGAIESVLAQTRPADELIVIDDGSTDETKQISDRFGRALRYIYQPNQGLAAARNAGILQAQGDYVSFLDDDDRWLPDFIEKMQALAMGHPSAVVCYCGSSYIDEQDRPLPQRATATVVPPEQVYSQLLRGNFLNPNTLLLDRDVAVAAGLFDIAFRRLQDWEFWLRLARAGHLFVGIDTPLVNYRLHDSSLSADTHGGRAAALAIAAKHFGPEEGMPQAWPADKQRMYGGVYRYAALLALQRQHDWELCAGYFKRAMQIDPTLADDISFFYELSLGTQPLGHRGTSRCLDLSLNESHIRQLLATIFEQDGDGILNEHRQRAFATAYLALGKVAYQARDFPHCRQWLAKAATHRPSLLRNREWAGMMIKTAFGSTNVDRLRRLKLSSKTGS